MINITTDNSQLPTHISNPC